MPQPKTASVEVNSMNVDRISACTEVKSKLAESSIQELKSVLKPDYCFTDTTIGSNVLWPDHIS